MRINNCAVLGHFGPKSSVAPPETGKTFLRKTRMPQKGTCRTRSGRRLHPLKPAKPFYGKQECPKKGHAAPDPGVGCTP